MNPCIVCRTLNCVSAECSVVLRARLESGCFDTPVRVEPEPRLGRAVTPDEYRTRKDAAQWAA